jgi:hypothetical protein
VTATPPRLLLASKVRKARYPRACARCRVPVRVGQLIGYVDQLGWCCLVPCIVSPAAA